MTRFKKTIFLLPILLSFDLQNKAFSEPISIVLPIVAKQPAVHPIRRPAVDNKFIGYHIYTDYDPGRGMHNWRHIPPNNLLQYGE